ncbi:MAG: flagellar protein FlaG [Sulfurimonas sp.]
MDGIANVARQQQSQVSPQETQGRTVEQTQLKTQQSAQDKNQDVVKQLQEASSTSDKKINSQKDVDELVEKLNSAISPLNTNIKFGVDQNDVFYVAAIDVKTNRMIRRFPAEQAQDFLPKMQEVTGILFDSKG